MMEPIAFTCAECKKEYRRNAMHGMHIFGGKPYCYGCSVAAAYTHGNFIISLRDMHPRRIQMASATLAFDGDSESREYTEVRS